MAKDRRISKEIRKLKKIFERIPENKQELVERLIENAAFMTVTLEDLQEKVRSEGPVVEITNGNGFRTTSEHPAQKSYNTMIARYAGVIKQLTDLLPDAEADRASKAGEELAAFIAKGKK